jgi:hypothetical protein
MSAIENSESRRPSRRDSEKRGLTTRETSIEPAPAGDAAVRAIKLDPDPSDLTNIAVGTETLASQEIRRKRQR